MENAIQPHSSLTDVLHISEPVQATNFQFAADIPVACGETAKSVTEKVIDCTYEWLSKKLQTLMPKRETFFSESYGKYALTEWIMPSLYVATIPEEGEWCCRLIHADESSKFRTAVPGGLWTVDIALHYETNEESTKVHFALRYVFLAIKEENSSIIIPSPVRPSLIRDIANKFHFTEALPIRGDKWINEIDCPKNCDALYKAVRSSMPTRQMPIVVYMKETNDSLLSLLLRSEQLDDKQWQSIMAFAHIVTLSESMRERWNERVGENLAVPQDGIRIYRPYIDSTNEPLCVCA